MRIIYGNDEEKIGYALSRMCVKIDYIEDLKKLTLSELENVSEKANNLKSDVEIAPVFVWTQDHVKAHYTICVLSHLINRTITIRLHRNKGVVSKEIVTHKKLFKEASKCKLDYIEVKNIQQKKFNLTKITPKQTDLLQRTGLPKLIDRNILDKANKNSNYAE